MWRMKQRLLAEADEGQGSPAPVVQEDTSSDDSNLWDDLLNDEVDEGLEVAEEVAVAATPEVEVGGEAEKPAVAAVEEPKPELIAAEEPKVVEKPAVVAPAPVQEVSQAVVEPQAAPQMGEADRELFRQHALQQLATRYKLSEEDATALQVEPEKVLPKLAATLHEAIYRDVLQRVAAEAPAFLSQSLSEKTANEKAEAEFYGRWGALRGHEEQVKQVAMMWRQMYPKASLAEAVEGIGSAAAALLGIQPGAGVPSAQPPPPAPPPPAGPSSRAGIAPPSKSRLSAEEQSFVDFANTFVEDY